MRRLPVYFLLDCSESMAGDNINRMEMGLERIVRSLRTDPYALETVYISVIAFAGIAKVLVPLVDIVSFYPPRLPLGSGTNLSAALMCLMDDLDRSIIKTTFTQKGDWRPVIYLITDGKPTNDIREAVDRWTAEYAAKAIFIAIGVGNNADFAVLSTLTPHVLKFEDTKEADFKQFIAWITASVAAQSRSMCIEHENTRLYPADSTIVSLIKDPPQSPVDESCITFVGRCTQNRQPYLIKYERTEKPVDFGGLPIHAYRRAYHFAGCYPLTDDYFAWSDPHSVEVKVDANHLEGTPPCPYCGASCAFAVCACGKLMCIQGPGVTTCPWCEQFVNFVENDHETSFDVIRSKG